MIYTGKKYGTDANLDKLVDSKDWAYRVDAAHQGYGLEKLILDNNPDVKDGINLYLERHGLTLRNWFDNVGLDFDSYIANLLDKNLVTLKMFVDFYIDPIYIPKYLHNWDSMSPSNFEKIAELAVEKNQESIISPFLHSKNRKILSILTEFDCFSEEVLDNLDIMSDEVIELAICNAIKFRRKHLIDKIIKNIDSLSDDLKCSLASKGIAIDTLSKDRNRLVAESSHEYLRSVGMTMEKWKQMNNF